MVNSLWTGVAWDRRDFFLNPTDGTLLSQRVTLTGGPLSGDRHFIVLDSEAEAFATLFETPIVRRLRPEASCSPDTAVSR